MRALQFEAMPGQLMEPSQSRLTAMEGILLGAQNWLVSAAKTGVFDANEAARLATTIEAARAKIANSRRKALIESRCQEATLNPSDVQLTVPSSGPQVDPLKPRPKEPGQ